MNGHGRAVDFDTKEEAKLMVKPLQDFFQKEHADSGDTRGTPFIRVIRAFHEERRVWVYRLLVSYPELLTQKDYDRFQKTHSGSMKIHY